MFFFNDYMNAYACFTKKTTKDQVCPILAESATLKDTDHPKQTIFYFSSVSDSYIRCLRKTVFCLRH